MRIVAVDCCEHVLGAVKLSFQAYVQVVTLTNNTIPADLPPEPTDLIVIGLSKFPVRRAYIDWLRHLHPNVPILIFRRAPMRKGGDQPEWLKGEFMLSDRGTAHDFTIVENLRRHLPLPPCEHAVFNESQDVVRNVMSVISEHYRDPDYDLTLAARQLTVPARKISRILNQQVGMSFRNLLRMTRIEEAKGLLASSGYSIKEVAAVVGFSDSHYFARSFKELTGLSATEFRRGMINPRFAARAGEAASPEGP